MKLGFAVAIASVLALSVEAQTQTQPATAPAESGTSPALISSAKIGASDSLLVRAAKRTLATRGKEGPKTTIRIDDATVRSAGRVSFATSEEPQAVSAATSRSSTSTASAAPVAEHVHRPDTSAADAEATRQKEADRQRVANEQADEPYANDVDEDAADRQVNEPPPSE